MLAMPRLRLGARVDAALKAKGPVVALESSAIAQGLSWPANWEACQASEAAVRQKGAVPATIAILKGEAWVGASEAALKRLAQAGDGAAKAAAGDLAALLVRGADGGTTVSGTLVLAALAGIRVMATGGLGGVHPGTRWDISADLDALSRSPVLVVCTGAKALLDLNATLEALETRGVPVVGYQTDRFPRFYLGGRSPHSLRHRVESPAEAARLARTHWEVLGQRTAVVLAVAPPPGRLIDPEAFEHADREAQAAAQAAGVMGSALTPYMLGALTRRLGPNATEANVRLLTHNAGLAGEVAVALATS